MFVLKGLIEALSVALLLAILVASVEYKWRGLGAACPIPTGVSIIIFAMDLDFHAGALAPAVSHMFCNQESCLRSWVSHTVSDNCHCVHVPNALTCMYSSDPTCIAWN